VTKKIGEFLRDLGVLTDEQVNEILRHSKSTGLRFGESAIKLGILRNDAQIKTFGSSFAVDFFHLEPDYFPAPTRDILPIESIIKYGALPLGVKSRRKFFSERKRLNVGFLDPTRKDSIAAVEATAKAALGPAYGGLKVYLVLADEFLEVLETVYGVSEERLKDKVALGMDQTLQSFLESVTVSPS